MNKAQKLIKDSKAVIFDMDGVIIDSIPLFLQARNDLLARHGITDQNKIKQFHVLGMGVKDILLLYQRELCLQGNIDKLAKEWRDGLYKLLLTKGNLTLLEGAEEFIRCLHGLKPLAVATGGHQKENAMRLLKEIGLNRYFKEIVSSDDVKLGKPEPDVYFLTAEKLKTDPKDCLVIEDAVNGTLAAKKAGMKVIGVNKDGELQKKLREVGVDIVVKSLKELI